MTSLIATSAPPVRRTRGPGRKPRKSYIVVQAWFTAKQAVEIAKAITDHVVRDPSAKPLTKSGVAKLALADFVARYPDELPSVYLPDTLEPEEGPVAVFQISIRLDEDEQADFNKLIAQQRLLDVTRYPVMTEQGLWRALMSIYLDRLAEQRGEKPIFRREEAPTTTSS